MISTWWVNSVIYLAILVVIGLALRWVHHSIYTQGRADERAELTAAYAERAAKAEAAAQARIRELEVKHRDKERQYADNLQTIGVKLSEVQQNAQRNETVLRARLATRDLILRDPGARSADKSCGGGVPQTAAAASGGDGGATSDVRSASSGVLSDAASSFLVGIAGEADAVARQLAACQDVIRSDRR